MIGEFRYDKSRAARRRTGHAIGEVICLATRAGEHYLAKLSGEAAQQPFSVQQDAFVDVARMRIEGRRLSRKSRHDMRMTMTDTGDVIVDV